MDQQKKRIRFLYNGSWTQWYDFDNIPEELKSIEIEACHVEEYMTREEAERYMHEHQHKLPEWEQSKLNKHDLICKSLMGFYRIKKRSSKRYELHLSNIFIMKGTELQCKDAAQKNFEQHLGVGKED